MWTAAKSENKQNAYQGKYCLFPVVFVIVEHLKGCDCRTFKGFKWVKLRRYSAGWTVLWKTVWCFLLDLLVSVAVSVCPRSEQLGTRVPAVNEFGVAVYEINLSLFAGMIG